MLCELATLIESNLHDILARWRAQVRVLPSARNLDTPTLDDHIPYFLQELANTFRTGSNKPIVHTLAGGSPTAHGKQRVKDDYDIEELVAEYNILRGSIHDLAERNGLSMQGEPFHILNRVLDGAIGSAVASFATRKALEVQHRREEYLAFVAHDLRTPLSAISLSSRVLELILLRDHVESPDATKKLATLNRNVKHLQDLIDKILEENTNLETETGVKLERRRFDLWPLVEALVHDLHPVAGTDSTRLVNEIPEDFVVFADASLLRRVFQNLIANAISYTPRGEVVIGATAAGADGIVECFVRDNGEGIPEDRCHLIFDKHETDSEKQGGLGLGLAIVKTFVEAHDGHVTVESKLGVGSTFRFTLPGQRS
ncbi:MAG: sensor histidine kinase [Planctomycetes bacterium]|nr:sensor histidine kinase [Planctomycetota bacterium]